MYHAVDHMRQLLESYGLSPGTPPENPGPGPDPEIDAYLFDGSRRLALLTSDLADEDAVAEPGGLAARSLDDEEAEEIARAIRVVAEAHPEDVADDDRDAFVEAAVAQAMDEWQSGEMFGDPPGLRHQMIEDVVRSAVERLGRGGRSGSE